jgi:hypothetical protein
MTWAFINTACLSYTVESLPQQDLGIHQWRMLFGLHDLGIHRYSMPFGCHWVVLTIVQPTLSHFPAYRDGIPLHDLGIHHYMTEWCCPLSNLHFLIFRGIHEYPMPHAFLMPSNVCPRIDSACRQMYVVEAIPQQDLGWCMLFGLHDLGIHQYCMPFGYHWLVLTVVQPTLSHCMSPSHRFCMLSNRFHNRSWAFTNTACLSDVTDWCWCWPLSIRPHVQ